jgi:N-acetylneuraminic acid mutarotase
VGGTVTGLVGTSLVLRNNGAEALTVSASGTFAFLTTVVSGAAYAVTIATQPTGYFCEVANGSGTVRSADIGSVAVTCRGWTWEGGASTPGASGAYGTMGTASAANVPGARTTFAQARDRSGNLWVFGGFGFDSSGARGNLNDLWKFDGSTWTWVSGSKLVGAPGVYGTMGTAAPGNSPGARQSAVLWGDAQGRIWVFGGRGLDSTGTNGLLNDLWRFDGAIWTWMGGANVGGASGNYGTRGTTSPTSSPGARYLCTTCVDSGGTLWLFGGVGFDSTGNSAPLNDLWKFDGTSWTWVSGSNVGSAAGVYGTKGTPAAANVPGARTHAAGWVDSSGAFWLFGGMAQVPLVGPESANDLWRFDGTNWTWVAGDAVSTTGVTHVGVYGTRGIAAAGNTPGGRSDVAAWADASGHLWLFGGNGADSTGNGGFLNDLWKFDGVSWTWVLGSNVAGGVGSYGTIGLAAATNTPGARSGAAGWVDAGGKFWLFGGTGFDPGGPPTLLNDVWRY